ncbi:MAG: hypothetical protein AABZ25_02150, partial [Nitrospirota bacterium]
AIKEKHKDKIAEAFADPDKITQALAQGVRDALLKHKQAGCQYLLNQFCCDYFTSWDFAGI